MNYLSIGLMNLLRMGGEAHYIPEEIIKIINNKVEIRKNAGTGQSMRFIIDSKQLKYKTSQ